MQTFVPPSFVCLASKYQTEHVPFYKSVTRTALPTLANLGSKFKSIGCAISGSVDMVTVTVNPVVKGEKVFVTNMVSMGVKYLHKLKGHLSYSVVITALVVMQLLNIKSIGLSITIEKGVPTRADLGSTTAMVIAASVAVNELFGAVLPRSDLVPLIIDSETKVSYYSYNVEATISGEFVIVKEIIESLSEYLDFKIFGEEVTISSCVSSILASDLVGNRLGWWRWKWELTTAE
ncbi:homoserine kinase-like [Cornus florida]|uniref:homoserine kinase-like n=1 Tax=Cornus florida TaxID=4283 RepID=UPI0028972A95|nr:homoserine kinase-like [Cornus florida]